VRGSRKREKKMRRGGERERERDSWFTCRHGNAASPLTCYSIGIARPSAAVLSQPPQEYERESRSIAWDRERADASFPDGRALGLLEARSLYHAEDRLGSSLSYFFFSFFPTTRAGKEKKNLARAVRHGITLFLRSTTTICTIGIITEEIRTPSRDIFVYMYIYILVVLSRCFLFHSRRNVEFERITETWRWGKSEHNIHPSLLRFVCFTRSVLPPRT